MDLLTIAQIQTQVCALGEYPSVANYLQLQTKITATRLKKFALSSKFLRGKLKSRQLLTIPLDLINHGHINPSYLGPPINILEDDECFLALEKPTNIHGHPHLYHDQLNCLSFLRQKGVYAPLQVAIDKQERGMLYRLDQGTSGVLVFAKTEEVFRCIRENFRQNVIAKEYLAVVQGKIAPEGQLLHYLGVQGRRHEKRLVWDRPSSPLGLPAVLTYQLEEYRPVEDCSRVRIFLQTGHRHQIRAQFSHIGHPLVGDELYGGRPSYRLFLHAHHYGFLFQHRRRDFISKIPQDFFLGFHR